VTNPTATRRSAGKKSPKVVRSAASETQVPTAAGGALLQIRSPMRQISAVAETDSSKTTLILTAPGVVGSAVAAPASAKGRYLRYHRLYVESVRKFAMPVEVVAALEEGRIFREPRESRAESYAATGTLSQRTVRGSARTGSVSRSAVKSAVKAVKRSRSR
jgi:hypothetical protein